MIAALLGQTLSWRVAEDFLVIPILMIAGTTWIVLHRQSIRAKERQTKLELLQQALNNPNVHRDTQEELLRDVRPTPGRLPFIIGWFGMFGGITWLCLGPYGEGFTIAVVCTVMSFALLTLPLAMRELDARRATQR